MSIMILGPRASTLFTALRADNVENWIAKR
jgi:hypothetical protein